MRQRSSAILKTVKSLNISKGSTDRPEIWHGDALAILPNKATKIILEKQNWFW